MVWREILSRAADYAAGKGVEAATVAVELLAARLLRCSRGVLPQALDREASAAELAAMRRGLKRVADGEPVQYVLGEWDFRRLTLNCDRRALIPRPETEELVTRVLAYLRQTASARRTPPFVVDVGTGTGAIILSLAQEYAGEAIFLGTDVSEDAIALARENAQRTGLAGRVRLAVADGLDDFDEPASVDVIVSNPPYVTAGEYERLAPGVRDWEPRLALVGGVDGLDFYRRYLEDALNVLRPGGAIFFEIGERQGPALAELMADCGFEAISIDRDFAGRDRYATGRLP